MARSVVLLPQKARAQSSEKRVCCQQVQATAKHDLERQYDCPITTLISVRSELHGSEP